MLEVNSTKHRFASPKIGQLVLRNSSSYQNKDTPQYKRPVYTLTLVQANLGSKMPDEEEGRDVPRVTGAIHDPKGEKKQRTTGMK